ncbi:hypothetical protein ACOME3_006034 [Neoechinorhynchus agilis]
MNDGSDFVHRGRVAVQYTTSVQYKTYLRMLVLLNSSVVALLLVLSYKCQSLTDQLLCDTVPYSSLLWSTMCLVAAISGILACRSNNIILVSIFKWIHTIIGPFIVLCSIVLSVKRVFTNLQELPITSCILFIFHLIAIQIHFVCWYVGRILMDVKSLNVFNAENYFSRLKSKMNESDKRNMNAKTGNAFNKERMEAWMKRRMEAKKRNRPPKAIKLDADLLISESKGIKNLYERGLAINAFKISEDGETRHGKELDDFVEIMKVYEHWARSLCSRYSFEEVIERVERLGEKKIVKSYMNRFRSGTSVEINDGGDIQDLIEAEFGPREDTADIEQYFDIPNEADDNDDDANME